MLVIRIELWPHGDRSRAKLLHIGYVANDATGTEKKGNYITRLYSRRGKLWRQGKVKDFPRLRLTAWDLLYRCLRETIGNRNGG